MTDPAIRAAATVVLWRSHRDTQQVLMGMRGAQAVFMPSKYVFPGGGVDPQDHQGHASGSGDLYLTPSCRQRLALHCDTIAPSADTLCRTALRETAEETGLNFVTPSPGTMQFIFRAITPPGRSRRFDARFFLANVASVGGDTTGFSVASGELSHLHWIGVDAARNLDLPFITEVVLAEVGAILRGHPQPGVPFFDNSGPVPMFRRLD